MLLGRLDPTQSRPDIRPPDTGRGTRGAARAGSWRSFEESIRAMDLKGLFVDSSPERVVQRAQRLALKGRADQAIAVIEEAIKRLGESADLRIEQATQLLTLGKVRPAADALRSLMKSNAGATDRVVEFIGWARTRGGDIDPLHEVLAEGFIARRRFQDAQRCFESVDRSALRGVLETRLANLNRFLESGAPVPKSAIQTLWFGALGYEVVEDWHRAFDSYRKVLASNPADLGAVEERLRGLITRNFKAVALRLAFAEILLTAGQKARALQEYMGAVEVDKRCSAQVRRVVETMLQTAPDDDNLLWAKARVCVNAGALDDAFAACDRLIERKAHIPEIESLLSELSSAGGDSVATRLMEARVAVTTGKAARATSAIVAAFDEDPGPRGLEILNEVIAAFPNDARPRLIQAEHLFKGGKLSESIEAWRAVKSLDAAMATQVASRLQSILLADPDNAQVLQLLEEVCTESGDAAAAVPFLRKRMREHPESAGAVLEQIRQLSMAAPEDPALWLAMTEAQLTAGDTAGAWNRLAMLLERGVVDRQTMHLFVLIAGSSAALFHQASTFVSSMGPQLSEIPEVVFALGESAGRAGLLREAIDRFRAAATACPPAASNCMKAIRDLGHGSAKNDDDRAALAEALVEAREMEGVNEVLVKLERLTPGAAARLIARLDAALVTDPSDLRLSEALARVCLVTGQVGRALEVSRTAAAGRNDVASARLTMTYGDAAARSGDLREGIRAYAAAVKRDTQLAGEAIERLKRLLTIDMGLETAHLALGRMLIAQGNVAKGISSLMTSASIKPQLAPVVLKDLEATARKFPGDSAIDFARSGLLLAAGDPIGAARCLGTHLAHENAPVDEILARLEGIAARHADSAPVMLELGRACHRKGWAERATAFLKDAYSLDRSLTEPILASLVAIEKDHPREAGVFLTRGLIHEEQGRPLPAAEAYLRVVGLGAQQTVALEGLRRLCRDADRDTDTAARLDLMRLKACAILGEVDEAIQASDAVLASGPDSAEEVLAELNRILKKNPGNVRAMLSRARCQLRLEDLDGAIAGLAEVLSRDRSCAAEVTRLARQILDHRPASVPAARLLADALRSQGNDDEAVRVLDSILATPVGGVNAEILLLRRSMAIAKGDDATARALLSRAENATTDKDRLLELLHREALASARGGDAAAAAVIEAVQAGRFLHACAAAEAWKPSTLKAWVLERSGRPAEAAACLREIIAEPAAQERFAAVHDAIVSRQIEGKAAVLMADVPLGAHGGPEGSRDDTIDRRHVAQKGGVS